MTLCRRLLVASSAAALLALSGCSLSPTALSSSEGSATVTVSGRIHGGEQPISGATISIYAAAATAASNTVRTTGVYTPSSNLTPIGSTTTNASGFFNFGTALTCTAGQQIYAVGTGGNPGNGLTNPNIILMAAIGACPVSGSLGTLVINIDEVTTVAAAYALSSFTTVSGTTVNVATSPTNNATVNTTSGSYSAAGLAHAFLNAANLASYTTGQAGTNFNASTSAVASVPTAEINALANALGSCVNSGGVTSLIALPGASPTGSSGGTVTLTAASPNNNPEGTLTVAVGSTPASSITVAQSTTLTAFVAQINSSAINTTQGVTASLSGSTVTLTGPAGAINTISTSGTSLYQDQGDASKCYKLFQNTTPPGGTQPVNTLQAILNLARNPYISSAAVAGVYSLVAPNVAFVPSLATQPADWTLSIIYAPTAPSTATLLTEPQFAAVDLYDNAYFDVTDCYTSACVTSGAMYSMASNGAINWMYTGFTAAQAGSFYQIQPDTIGNIWIPNNSGTFQFYSLPTGTSTLAPGGALPTTLATYTGLSNSGNVKAGAIDAKQNVWWGRASSSGDILTEFVNTAGTYGPTYPAGTNTFCACSPGTQIGSGFGFQTGTAGANGVAIDQNQNVWYAGNYLSASNNGLQAVVLPNTNAGTATAAAYFAPALETTSSTGYIPATLTTGLGPSGIAIDAGGNAWSIGSAKTGTTPQQLQKITPNTTSGPITSLTVAAIPTTGATFSVPMWPVVDGSGTVWLIDSQAHSVFAYNAAYGGNGGYKSQNTGFEPCLINPATSTCYTNSYKGYPVGDTGGKAVAVDSTGTLWVAASAQQCNVIASPFSTTCTAQETGTFIQIFGVGTPTWPLAVNNPGVMP